MIRHGPIVMTLAGLLVLSATRAGAGDSPGGPAGRPGPGRLRVTTFNILHDGVRSLAARG